MILALFMDIMESKILRFWLTFSAGSISDSLQWETGSVYTSVMVWKVMNISLQTNAENRRMGFQQAGLLSVVSEYYTF